MSQIHAFQLLSVSVLDGWVHHFICALIFCLFLPGVEPRSSGLVICLFLAPFANLHSPSFSQPQPPAPPPPLAAALAAASSQYLIFGAGTRSKEPFSA